MIVHVREYYNEGSYYHYWTQFINSTHAQKTRVASLEEGAKMARIYVGDLGSNGSKQDIEREFERYGNLRSVWVARNPPGFAFIEFEDPRDADEAVQDMDGKVICGSKIRVEFAKNSSQPEYARRGFSSRRGPPPAVVSSRYRSSPRRRSRWVSRECMYV